MSAAPNLDVLAEACLTMNEVVAKHGTSEMHALARVLLFMVGRELAAAGKPIGDGLDLKTDDSEIS